MKYILSFWSKMFDYKGTAGRKEFWIGFAVNAILYAIISTILKSTMMFVTVMTVAAFSPSEKLIFPIMMILGYIPRAICYIVFQLAALSAKIRRLRDTGYSVWLGVLFFIPFVDLIAFVFLFFKSKESRLAEMFEQMYDPAILKPILKCSICNGEQTAGFRDIRNGEFHDVMLVQSEKDLNEFKRLYRIEGDIEKEY